MKNNPINEMLTPDGACEKLNVSLISLLKWSRSGKLLYYKVGNKTFYRSSDIENLGQK